MTESNTERGRSLDTVRVLNVYVNVLPRLFTRESQIQPFLRYTLILSVARKECILSVAMISNTFTV